MTDEQKAAYVNGMAAVLMAKVAGMQAENTQRRENGWPVTYIESDFDALINASGVHHNAILELFGI